MPHLGNLMARFIQAVAIASPITSVGAVLKSGYDGEAWLNLGQGG